MNSIYKFCPYGSQWLFMPKYIKINTRNVNYFPYRTIDIHIELLTFR